MNLTTQKRKSPAHPTYAKIYYLLAPFYDLVFDLPFHPGRFAAAGAVDEAIADQGNLLVVGVGTGLELELLTDRANITGIDLAQPMLDVARERVARKALRQVKALRVMDAQALDFADASFDVTLAPYVLSVVPSPRRVLDEMWRVTRPGGEMIILNHFSDDHGWRARAETLLDGAGACLGWRPHFPFSAIIGTWLEQCVEAKVVETRAIAPFKLFTLLRIKKAS